MALCAIVFCIAAISLASAQAAPGNSAIKGIVYNDTNKDGSHQLTEAGVPGLTIELLDAGGALAATLVTDHNGYFNFTGLSAGQYTVYVVVPQGYTNSSARSVAVSLQDNSLGKTCIGIYVVDKPPCHKDRNCYGDDKKCDKDKNCDKDKKCDQDKRCDVDKKCDKDKNCDKKCDGNRDCKNPCNKDDKKRC
jgi:hypothetical protein